MNKRVLFVAAALVVVATGMWALGTRKQDKTPDGTSSPTEVRNDLQHYFSDVGTDGTMVVKKQHDHKLTVVNESRSKAAYLPSSTFKIANSLIALQEKVVSSPDEVMKGPHPKLMVDGKSFLPAICEGDVTLQQAFQNSCATVYQGIARHISAKTYQKYIDAMQYGNRNISSVPIDEFWLEGDLAITPEQQVSFLQKLYEGNLPFSKAAMDATKRMMFVEEANGVKIFGKTGWVFSQKPNVGWWVGWAEKDGHATFFAIDLDILKPEHPAARMTIAKQILHDLKVL